MELDSEDLKYQQDCILECKHLELYFFFPDYLITIQLKMMMKTHNIVLQPTTFPQSDNRLDSATYGLRRADLLI